MTEPTPPGDTVPLDPTPEPTPPGDTLPLDAIPAQTPPGDTLPLDDATPEPTPPGDTVPLSGVDPGLTTAPPGDAEDTTNTVLTPPPESGAPQDPNAPPTHIGRYRIVHELARGGMGVVYVAHDPQLGRNVALKVMRSGADATPQERERFSTEARAAARLVHPNIVAILDVGEDRGQRYFAMELIEGESLQQRIKRKGRLEPAEAARFARSLAEALYYAHSQAILHRDMKPDNVLIDGSDQPRITDFGIAKDVRDGAPSLTKTGQLVGTPAYMPPEQANGDLDRIDRRADVYALGATLYCMLVGEPPFTGNSTMGIVAKVLSEEPTPPRRLRPQLDRDLETICLKALEKEPEQRYTSAAALAEDLGRYLANQTITARPPTTTDRARKWLRRNRSSARLLGAFAAVTLLAGLGGTAWFVQRLAAAKQRAERSAAEAERQRGLAEDQARRAEQLRALAEEREAEARAEHQRAEEQAQEAKRQAERAMTSMAESERRIGDAQEEKARGLVERGEWADAAALLADALRREDSPERRGALLRALANVPKRRTLPGFEGGVTWLGFSPDGRTLAGTGPRGRLRLWSLGGEPLRDLSVGHSARHGAWSPDGALLAVSTPGDVQVWDVKTGSQLARLDHENVACLTWSPDSTLLACGGNRPSLSLWKARTGEQLAKHTERKGRIDVLAFDDSGRLLVSGSYQGELRVRRAADGWAGAPLPEGHSNRVRALSFVEGLPILASAGDDRTIKLWDANTGEAIKTLSGHGYPVTCVRWVGRRRIASGSSDGSVRLWEHVGGRSWDLGTVLQGHSAVNSLAVSDDGTRLASFGQLAGRVWSASGEPEGTLAWPLAKHDYLAATALSGDGTHVALVSRLDSTVQLFETSRDPCASLRAHEDPLREARWLAGPSRVLAADVQNTLTFWSADRRVPLTRRRLPGRSLGLRVSPDGTHLAVRVDLNVLVFSSETGRELARFKQLMRVGTAATYGPRGRLAVAGRDHEVRIYGADLTLQRELRAHQHDVLGLAFSPDGQRLATSDRRGTLRIWNPDTGEQLGFLPLAGAELEELVWSPDGERLAVVDWKNTLAVYQVDEFSLQFREADTGRALAFADDGRLAVGGRIARRVRVWDASGGELESLPFPGATAISWKGSRLAAARGDQEAVLWEGGKAPPIPLSDDSGEVAWSPDGDWLAHGDGKRVAIRAADGTLHALLPGHAGAVRSVAFSADGTQLLTAGAGARVFLWNLEWVLAPSETLADLSARRTERRVELLQVFLSR